MNDRLLWILMSLLPKNTLSRMAGSFASSQFSRLLIPAFARRFEIDIGEAEKPIAAYQSLTDFFTRRLHTSARPISPESDRIVSPADGRLSQFGTIREGCLLQAKGVTYTVAELLGQDTQRAARYEGGSYTTIYLSPKDYHRIHTPYAGAVIGYSYIPGSLFPVNPFGVRAVKGLFAKNERLITYLDTPSGEIAVAKVGATIVGSVKVVYDEKLGTNVRHGKLSSKAIQGPALEKGNELGWFEFGSTVVLLFEKHVTFEPTVKEGDFIRMGESLGWFS